MKTITLLALTAALSAPAWAHPGGVDAEGCHKPKHGPRHCHGAQPARTAPPQARTAEERRLVRECKGRPNAGACAGYAR